MLKLGRNKLDLRRGIIEFVAAINSIISFEILLLMISVHFRVFRGGEYPKVC